MTTINPAGAVEIIPVITKLEGRLKFVGPLCDNPACSNGVVTEVVRYREIPSRVAYEEGTGGVREMTLKRRCLRCSGRGFRGVQV